MKNLIEDNITLRDNPDKNSFLIYGQTGFVEIYYSEIDKLICWLSWLQQEISQRDIVNENIIKETVYTDNRHTYIYTKNKKVTSFATGDDRAGGLWDLEGKDKLEDKKTRQWLLECINKLPRKQYLAFSDDVGKDFVEFIDRVENKDEE